VMPQTWGGPGQRWPGSCIWRASERAPASLRVLVAETGPVTGHLRAREIDDEGRRLVRIVRRDSGSVVTWRRAQMVLLSAQGMDVSASRRWRSPARTGVSDGLCI